MRSPFPGMDPYLARYWNEIHMSLCCEVRTDLQPWLRPRGLRARTASKATPTNDFDTFLVEVGRAPWTGSALATVEPVLIRALPSVQTARWVEVIDVTNGDRVVTAIEVLSRGNKAAGELNRRYRRKLRRYTDGGISVVEIDLLRSTRERLAVPMLDLPPDRRAAYCTCVKWAANPDLWAAYPMPLREPLPTVPVPCRPGEPDVPLALQPILDRIYDEGGYDSIDYAAAARPPLSADDAAWAADRVAHRPA